MSEEKKQSNWGIWLVLAVILVVGMMIYSAIKENAPKSYVSSRPSRTYNKGGMSEYERKKTFYDMIAVQDQHPYDNAWNEGVKKAAAGYYNVPMDVINDIPELSDSLLNFLYPRVMEPPERIQDARCL